MYSERRRNKATKANFILYVTVLENKYVRMYISSCYANYKMKMGSLGNCYAIPNCSNAPSAQWNIPVTVIGLESVPNVWKFLSGSLPFHFTLFPEFLVGQLALRKFNNSWKLSQDNSVLSVPACLEITFFLLLLNGKFSVQSAAHVPALLFNFFTVI